MDVKEAREWISGNRSTTNMIPKEPRESWLVRIAQADAYCTEEAYWILKAEKDGLIPPKLQSEGGGDG